MTKTILTLAIAMAAVAVSVSAAGAVAEAAPVPALAQDDVFDYSQYETPPIWQDYKTLDEEFVPINQRPGGARGGDVHGRRRRSMQKRVVIHEVDNLSFNFGAQVDPVDATLSLNKRAEDLDEDPQYVDQDEEQDELDEDQDEEDEDDGSEEDEEEDEEEELAAEEEEDEERRLDNEAGLEDWIDEMRSEEYRNLAGHPEGRGLDDEQFQQLHGEDEEEMQEYSEDEPQPSEEEIFAASWSN